MSKHKKVSTTKSLQVNLKEFPIHKLELNSKIVVIGKPGTGKSCLLTDIAYNVKHKIPVAAAWSGTEESNGAWSSVLPPLFVYDTFVEKAIEFAVLRQKLTKQLNTLGNLNYPGGLYIWDDCMDDPTYFMKKIMVKIFKNGRHYGESVFLAALQYSFDVKPVIRSGVDYAFLLMEKNKSNREKLFKNYASSFPDFETFDAVMDQVTDNFGCIVINNKAKTNAFEDTVFYYTARLHAPWRFGCREYRIHGKERYNANFIPSLTV